MKNGTPTNVRGLLRVDESTWILRATRTIAGVKTEQRRTFSGTKAEARAALETLRAEVKAGAEREERSQAAPETLTAFAQRWLQSIKAKRGDAMKQVSLDTRARNLERFVLPFFGSKLPAEIEPTDVEDWKEWLGRQRQPANLGRSRNPRAGKRYAHDTLLSAWATARALFTWVQVKTRAPSPIEGVRFDVVGLPRRQKETLSQAELGRLIAAAKQESPDIRAMLVLGLASGMRFCELSALEWRDIDLERGVLRIERSQVRGQVGPPKTEATRRDVVLSPEVVDVLREHRRWQEAAGFLDERGVVFPATRAGKGGGRGKAGGYRYSAVLTKPLARCCARAGVDKHLTSHCLRGTLSNLVRQSSGDAAARAMVGHATADMTFRYSDVDRAERLANQKRALGDWLTPASDHAPAIVN